MEDKPQVNLKPVEEMLDRLSVSAAFGAATREGDVTIIPVASVTYGFGYGSGYGRSGADDEAEADDEAKEEGTPGEGAGSGAGGGGMTRPVGFIRIGADGASYEPLFNPQLVSLAGIALSAWSVFWITKTIRAFVRR